MGQVIEFKRPTQQPVRREPVASTPTKRDGYGKPISPNNTPDTTDPGVA